VRLLRGLLGELCVAEGALRISEADGIGFRGLDEDVEVVREARSTQDCEDVRAEDDEPDAMIDETAQKLFQVGVELRGRHRSSHAGPRGR
jgi:hypothetical protein